MFAKIPNPIFSWFDNFEMRIRQNTANNTRSLIKAINILRKQCFWAIQLAKFKNDITDFTDINI